MPAIAAAAVSLGVTGRSFALDPDQLSGRGEFLVYVLGDERYYAAARVRRGKYLASTSSRATEWRERLGLEGHGRNTGRTLVPIGLDAVSGTMRFRLGGTPGKWGIGDPNVVIRLATPEEATDARRRQTAAQNLARGRM